MFPPEMTAQGAVLQDDPLKVTQGAVSDFIIWVNWLILGAFHEMAT